ncbi:Terminal uridylyltransferase 4, partial [Stegodyphus mimosarum]
MYLGRSEENACKIACLLKEVCALDHRIKTLLIATRIWAEVCVIHEAEDGKLPPVAFNLLVVHFLQHLEQPILPIIDISVKGWGLESYQNSNTAEVGELWLEFLNYYRTFNWEDNVVSVVHKQPVLKTSKPWKPSWITIEDPFSGKNVADSVISLDVANFIKSCFSKFYNYFSLPPDELAESNVKNSEGHMKQECKKRRYSFSSCELQDIPMCERCEEYGVTCEDCLISPSKVVQELPELSSSSMEKVDQVLQEICRDYVLPPKRIEARKAFVQDLETYVRKIYSRARLTLFGSSVNGFGFKKSDLDICLTFEGCKKEDINIQRTMRVLKRHLRRNKDFENVLILSRAQIPIIKFNYTPGKFICDISFYNILAVHNSTLLRTYSLLNERCQILGCAFKYLAKKAFIADTLIKTLSSYSYILMVIHYLQQVEPPVLPVLSIQDEEVFEENLIIPVETARKHDWLCKDIQSLKNIYNKRSRNKLTAGQLWLGLLKFYLQVNSDYVISIKQKEAVPISSLPRSAALYNIEDPFLVKNLGCIVSQMKASVIWNTLNRARLLFGKEISYSGKDLKDYYFSSMNLTGRYVAEELCTLCGKYGHSKAKCPHNLN